MNWLESVYFVCERMGSEEDKEGERRGRPRTEIILAVALSALSAGLGLRVMFSELDWGKFWDFSWLFFHRRLRLNDSH